MHVFFFFQAEDGIRDLVRSRGLGDVYKRQLYYPADGPFCRAVFDGQDRCPKIQTPGGEYALCPVSYTHLTLPTSDLV